MVLNDRFHFRIECDGFIPRQAVVGGISERFARSDIIFAVILRRRRARRKFSPSAKSAFAVFG